MATKNNIRRFGCFCIGWLIANLIALPVTVLVRIARAAEALARGIAWLVDDRAWTRRIFGAADRIEMWGRGQG